jgi:hypothetical protein
VNNSKRFTVPLAIVLALAITPALSGCFGNPLEQIVEGATGGDVDLPSQSVPEDFPSEVPLIEGDIIFGMGVGNEDGKAWNVTVKVGGLDAAEQIASDLEGAGFAANEAGVGGATEEGATLIYDNGTYNVLVVVGKDTDNGFIASYTVAETN